MNKTSTRRAYMCSHVNDCDVHSQWRLLGTDMVSKERLVDVVRGFSAALLFAFVLLIVPVQKVSAQTTQQNITVKGKVLDADDSTTIPSVSITNATTRQVVGQTNVDGNFSVTVPSGATLVFSFIGYTSNSATYTSSVNNVNIRLKSSSSNLETVVVTALGIKREERALGYATTTIDSTQVTNAVSSNWTDALSGKVAGLNLVRNSGPSGSNKIILRGENNLTGDNEALIVIDGIIASSSSRRTASTGGGAYGTGGDIMPVDFGSGLGDINPDDIESVTVLKGPAASALYGQRGANGAVVITTKSASSNRKTMGITFTSNSTWEDINRRPDRQFEYGQGQFGVSYFSYGASADGPSTNATSASWGAPFLEGSQFFQYDPATQARGLTRTPWVAYDDPLDAFFTTGFSSNNSVSLDGTFKKVNMRLSASHGNNEWIVPNTGLERTNVTFNANTKLTDKLTINIKAQYSNRHSDNLPATGYGNQSLMYWYMFSQPNVNTHWYKEYWRRGREFIEMVNLTTTQPEGPYAISEQYLNGQRRNGWTGNIQANYKFTKELSLMVRASGDLNNDKRETRRPWDAAGGRFAQGSFRVSDVESYEINADFMLRYDKEVNKDVRVSASLGGSQMRNEYSRLEVRADGLVLPNIYSLDNNQNPLIYVPDTARYRINSLYAAATISYKNYLYLDITGRQDWNSTLATINRTDNVGFFYPSASVSFIASDFWKLPKAVNLAKFRGSIAQVGSGSTTPYRTAYNYVIASNDIYPGSQMTNPTILPNSNLKPLITTTVELGLDLKMFKNRLNFDLAVYAGNTKNQILNRIVDRATGYNVGVFNVGRVDNKGIELAVNGVPYQTKNFKWTLNGTFSANRNKVVELGDSSVVLRTGGLGGGQVVANVGGSMGDLYGRGYERSPDGQIVFNSAGNAIAGQELIYLGNTMPQFRFSFGTGATYKQFSMNVLFDAQLGAVGHSLTFSRMAAMGKLKVTLPGRYNGLIGDGVVQNNDGSYRPNDIIATNMDNYYYSIYGSDQAEGSIFSTDYIKFREANLTYNFKKSFLNKIGFNKMSLGIFGRDLFIWSPWPAFDPEFGTLAGSDIVQGFETGQLPSTRTMGLRLVVGI